MNGSRPRRAARKRRCVSGGHAGTQNKAWRIDLGLGGLGFFPPEVRAQATAVACSRPQAEGVPLARGSYAGSAQLLVALGVVVSVATSTIGRWLRAERVKPWRDHLWQHVRDPRFLELAKPVLRLYELPQVLYHCGVWVVCTDEKTSIQAREGMDAPQPAAAGQLPHSAARYERRGALQLFAGLSV